MYSNVVPVMQFVSARDLHYRIEGWQFSIINKHMKEGFSTLNCA